MAKKSNIIELNGNRYDAVTGSLLGPQTSSPSVKPLKASAVHRTATPVKSGGAIDGFVRTKHTPTYTSTHVRAAVTPVIPVKPAPKVAQNGVAHISKPIAPHQPEHSKTLMRHTVKAPKIVPKKPLKAIVPTDLTKLNPAVLTVKPKLSSEQVDNNRAERAKQTPRSTAVDRFHRPTRLGASRRAALAQGAPVTNRAPLRTLDGMAAGEHVTQRRGGSAFDQAVSDATSHLQQPAKEPTRHKARRVTHQHIKLISIAASTLAVVIFAGFIAYINRSAVELELASTKAGFHASMPAYRPAGYAYSGLHYSSGSVTIGFNAGAQSYTLTQKESNWDNETLLDNYVALTGSAYQAYSAAGRTVYVYGNGNATWVSNGIWYQVQGNAHLSTHQIVDIATSM